MDAGNRWSQERRRAERRTKAVAGIARRYNPWAHLGCSLMLAAGAGAVALSHVRSVQPLEWLTVPVVLIIANAIEWVLHCQFMHHLRWLGGGTYRRHALHHALFVADEMAIGCARELRFVLIHPVDLATLAAIMAAIAGGLGLVLSKNCGWLALVTCAVYLAFYELSHLLCHFPAETGLGRLAQVRRLRSFHARHHRPERMARFNFNVTVPIFDWAFRTLLRQMRHG
jgi:Fatty acid hydroxylase superfamily